MIEFVTLLLGLLIGPQAVELSAGPGVASIHLVLDGRTVEVLDAGPPWRATLDLGDALRPRRLEAVAYDRRGRETGRAQQVLNTTRPSFGIGITLGGPRPGGGRAGRVVWRAVLDQTPSRLDVRFDGEPVVVDEGGDFTLPPYDLGSPHVIEATATFPDGNTTRAERAIGGGLGEEVTSALSPLAIRSRRGWPWSVEDVQGWIEREDRPIGIFATRSTPRRVVLVRDIAANRAVEPFGVELERMGVRIPWRGEMAASFLTLVSPVPIDGHAGSFQVTDVPTVMIQRDHLRRATTVHYVVHAVDDAADARDRQKLWAALAIAGKRAAASRGSRVVFLMVDDGLDPGTGGWDQPTLATARDFLASLRVPLVVWAPTHQGLETLGLDDDDRAFHGSRGLIRALQRLDRELETQTLVLVEGDVLPHEVTLSDDVPRRVKWVR